MYDNIMVKDSAEGGWKVEHPPSLLALPLPHQPTAEAGLVLLDPAALVLDQLEPGSHLTELDRWDRLPEAQVLGQAST